MSAARQRTRTKRAPISRRALPHGGEVLALADAAADADRGVAVRRERAAGREARPLAVQAHRHVAADPRALHAQLVAAAHLARQDLAARDRPAAAGDQREDERVVRVGVVALHDLRGGRQRHAAVPALAGERGERADRRVEAVAGGRVELHDLAALDTPPGRRRPARRRTARRTRPRGRGTSCRGTRRRRCRSRATRCRAAGRRPAPCRRVAGAAVLIAPRTTPAGSYTAAAATMSCWGTGTSPAGSSMAPASGAAVAAAAGSRAAAAVSAATRRGLDMGNLEGLGSEAAAHARRLGPARRGFQASAKGSAAPGRASAASASSDQASPASIRAIPMRRLSSRCSAALLVSPANVRSISR